MYKTQYGKKFLYTSRSKNTEIILESGVNEDFWVEGSSNYIDTGVCVFGQTIASSTTPTELVVAFTDSLDTNLRPSNYTYSGGKITVNTRGVYLINAYVEVPSDSAGARIITILNDGEEIQRTVGSAPSGTPSRQSISAVVLIQSFNEISIGYAQTSGGNLSIDKVYYSIIKLGGIT